MILADTSIWVEHFRGRSTHLAALLDQGLVVTHPFVLGELACGLLSNRAEILELLGNLPRVPIATDMEALEFIERHALMGAGIGFIDVHLLAAVALSGGARLWTRDVRLGRVAAQLKLAIA